MINLNQASTMSTIGIGIVLILVTITIALCAILVWLITKNIKSDNKNYNRYYLIIIVAGGVIVRFVLSLFFGGFRDLSLTYKNIVESFSITGGMGEFYDRFIGEIFPLPYYLILILGGLSRALGFAVTTAESMVFIKFPLIIADAITILLLNKIASKYINEKVGLIIAGAYAFSPVFIIESGIYGSTIAYLIPLLIWAGYSLVNKRHFQAIFAYSLAMITHILAVYAFPVFVIYFGYRFIRSIIVSINAKKAGAKGLKSKLCIKIPVYSIVSFITIYLICLPISLSSIGANPLVFIYSLTLKPLASVYYFSNNGISIYNLFGRNAIELGNSFPTAIFIIIFALIICGIISVVYFSKRNTASVCLILTHISYTVITYYVGANLTDIVVICALLLLSYILTQDKRILTVFALTSLSATIASITALDNANCLNMYEISYFYKTVFQITDGVALVFLIVSSVISIISHIYLSFTLLDITIANKRKLLAYDENATITSSINNLFK